MDWDFHGASVLLIIGILIGAGTPPGMDTTPIGLGTTPGLGTVRSTAAGIALGIGTAAGAGVEVIGTATTMAIGMATIMAIGMDITKGSPTATTSTHSTETAFITAPEIQLPQTERPEEAARAFQTSTFNRYHQKIPAMQIP